MIELLRGAREVVASHTAMGMFSGMTLFSAIQIESAPLAIFFCVIAVVGFGFSMFTEMSDA